MKLAIKQACVAQSYDQVYSLSFLANCDDQLLWAWYRQLIFTLALSHLADDAKFYIPSVFPRHAFYYVESAKSFNN